jgi:hypothetical protein
VVQAFNPIYAGGRALGKKLAGPHLNQYVGQGDMYFWSQLSDRAPAYQAWGPEFKLLYCQNNNKYFHFVLGYWRDYILK